MPSSFADKWLLVNCIGTVGRKVIMYSESYALFLLISFFVCILVVPAVICTQACTMYVYNSIRIHIPLSSMFILLVSDRQSHVMFRHWVSCHPDVIAIMGSFFPREVGSWNWSQSSSVMPFQHDVFEFGEKETVSRSC